MTEPPTRTSQPGRLWPKEPFVTGLGTRAKENAAIARERNVTNLTVNAPNFNLNCFQIGPTTDVVHATQSFGLRYLALYAADAGYVWQTFPSLHRKVGVSPSPGGDSISPIAIYGSRSCTSLEQRNPVNPYDLRFIPCCVVSAAKATAEKIGVGC